MRQGSLVSNTTIIRDTRNVQISQTLSAVKTEGSRPDYFHFRKHRQIRTIQNPNSRRRRNQNYSLFIIHYSLNKKSAPFQTTDLDIKFQCKIKVCRPPVTQLSPIGNSQNGEFVATHCHPPVTEVTQIANLQNGEFATGHTRRPPVTQLSPIGNNQNGEFTAAHSHTANLKRLTAARRICRVSHPPPAYLVPNSLSPASPTPGVMYRSSLSPSSSAPQ